MVRKSLGLLLVLAVVMSLGVASVSAQDTAMECPEGDADVVIAAGAVGIEFEVVQAQADRFMAMCPNVSISLLETPDLATDRLGLYQQYWEAQTPDVDIYQVDVIWAGIIAPHVVDLLEYVPEGYLDQFFPAMVAGQNIGGVQVAIPWFTDAAGLYYRTDLLEKYSLEVPTTWDELTAAAQTIQDGERAAGNADFAGYVWQGNAYEGLTCDAHEWLVSETGETFISPEGEVNVNNDAFVAALERAAGWVGGISPEGVTTYGEEESRAVWQAGNAAFMRNWAYAYTLGQAEDSPIRDKFDVGALPGKEAGMSGATLGGWGIGVSRYSQNIEAASAFAMWVTSYDQLVDFHLARGEQPVQPALYEDPELVEALPYLASLGNVLEFAAARPGVAGAQYNAVSELYYTAVNGVLAGSADAATAMADLELALADLGFELP